MQLAPFKIKDERHPQSSRAVLIYVNLGRVTIQIQVQVYTIRLTRPATGLESAKFLGVFSRPIFVIWTFFFGILSAQTWSKIPEFIPAPRLI